MVGKAAGAIGSVDGAGVEDGLSGGRSIVGTGIAGREMSLSWSGGILRGKRAPVASRRV